MTDTPTPLSADSLRTAIVKCFYTEQIKTDDDEIESGAKEEYIEYFDTTAVIDKLEALIAAALQSERQRIADSLPRGKDWFNKSTFAKGDDRFTGRDEAMFDQGFNECLEAVRAVLIPPTGKLGGFVTPSEPAEPKDTKSITKASASEEER